MELDEKGLAAEHLKLAKTRLEAHRRDPASALGPQKVWGRPRRMTAPGKMDFRPADLKSFFGRTRHFKS